MKPTLKTETMGANNDCELNPERWNSITPPKSAVPRKQINNNKNNTNNGITSSSKQQNRIPSPQAALRDCVPLPPPPPPLDEIHLTPSRKRINVVGNVRVRNTRISAPSSQLTGSLPRKVDPLAHGSCHEMKRRPTSQKKEVPKLRSRKSFDESLLLSRWDASTKTTRC